MPLLGQCFEQAQYLFAIHSRHHQVQQHQIELLLDRIVEPNLRVRHRYDPIAGSFQMKL